MPLIATRGAASAQGFGEFAQSAAPNYIEDVFSTYLYTGNSPSTQTITNGIDLSGKGGMVWVKSRVSGDGATYNNILMDTVRGTGSGNILYGNLTLAAQTAPNAGISSFNSNGFSLRYDDGYGTNYPSGGTFASWTFRKQPKFFDVVTYTGNNGTGSGIQTIAHNLGSVPGTIIVKCIDTAPYDWIVYHRSLGATKYAYLNTTAAADTFSGYWNNTAPTSTEFTVGTSGGVNGSGQTYVAYLFAHNAGGFGLTGTDNVISCGSATGDPATYLATVDLGYEPQWVLTKSTASVGNWTIIDNMRGMTVLGSTDARLFPNNSQVESSTNAMGITSTGFITETYGDAFIYIAIRRGPMKVPTSGTSVFSPVLQNGGGTVTTNFPVDLAMGNAPANGTGFSAFDRLRGSSTTSSVVLYPYSTDAELALTSNGLGFANNTGYVDNAYGAVSRLYLNWRRAPSFFDEVCYTGTGTGSRAVTHNLGIAPEMVIVKQRTGTPDRSWWVLTTAVPLLNILNSTQAANASGVPANLFGDSTYNNYIAPTATTVTLSPSDEVNKSGSTYVAYLFATCAGVSKVGSYTGNGSTQTIDCGFGAGGARFVLIKRTDSTGGWYVYDTARGMTVLTDPYLFMNSQATETATLGSVTTVSTGFALNATILSAINTNAASYIFLAIA